MICLSFIKATASADAVAYCIFLGGKCDIMKNKIMLAIIIWKS